MLFNTRIELRFNYADRLTGQEWLQVLVCASHSVIVAFEFRIHIIMSGFLNKFVTTNMCSTLSYSEETVTRNDSNNN